MSAPACAPLCSCRLKSRRSRRALPIAKCNSPVVCMRVHPPMPVRITCANSKQHSCAISVWPASRTHLALPHQLAHMSIGCEGPDRRIARSIGIGCMVCIATMGRLRVPIRGAIIGSILASLCQLPSIIAPSLPGLLYCSLCLSEHTG